jgi:chloramphenicol-sensitive protein RarD
VTLTERQRGLAAALGAYVLWGMLPLYFAAVASVSTAEIVGNRILWSAVLVIALVFVGGQGRALTRAFATKRQIWGLIASSICITTNWSFFAWAVPNGHAIDAGFGYLLNPLVTVLLAFLVLGERLTPARWLAILLAAGGVASLAYARGGVPWIVLILPVSFSVYGLLRKVIAVDAMVGLGVETLLVAPFCAAYLATLPHGGALLGQGWTLTGLMMLGGPATAVPLFFFAHAARRMPLANLGMLHYISPTIQLALAIAVFKEPVRWPDIVAFGLIWAGIAVYSFPAGKGVDKLPNRGQIALQAVSRKAGPK